MPLIKQFLNRISLHSSCCLAFTLIALLLFQTVRGQAQEHPAAELETGEQVPEVALSTLLHYPSATASLSDFRGRVLLLQFWATTCGSSLLALPKLEALQQTFGDSLQVLTITSQKREEVEAFLASNPIGRRMKLPIVLNNRQLEELFPYNAVPHLVWISPKGRLLAQTGPYDATPATIRRLLRGQEGNFKDHKKDIMDHDHTKPLFHEGNGGSPFPSYRSILTPYVPGLGGGSGKVKTDSTLRLQIVNASVAQLLRASCGLPSYFPEKQIFLASEKARAHQVHNLVEERQHKNYCYEMLLPAALSDKLYTFMRQDLERLFGLQASVRKKRIDCWELTLLYRAAVPRSAGGEPGHNFTDVSDPDKYMRNEPVNRLVVFLNKHIPDLLVLDKTGITYPLDLQLSEGDLQDISRLNARLAAYGLQLQKKKRPLQVLIIQ
ncbi:redoxin domain-containing protein [Pontibacter virosus]|uniref:Thiol-disulfide isomerase/thioredoxin n=1 Tax=Pontibacter virosus TaxID=1765052 RepID=A0A2U1B4S6_9BACT|nr:redoxin domain-containing protein [Pontibacter virosus]PVY43648.1 thiol-disulfide isomerase/thioredoxin [Pontibacter virosus]